MESTKCASNMIVPTVLTEGNYEIWKIFVKNYLLGEGLWDIVEGSEGKPEDDTNPDQLKAWTMRNGKALHAIMISCGEKMSFHMRGESAKDAWDHLAARFQTRIVLPSHAAGISAVSVSVSTSSGGAAEMAFQDGGIGYLAVYRAVYLNDWETTRRLLVERLPDSMTAIISPPGETVLHVAVRNGNLHFVNRLLALMTQAHIPTVIEGDSSTPLHIAAACGFTKIAEALVEKDRNPLEIPGMRGYIPVVAACAHSHKDTTRYLYRATGLPALIEGDRNRTNGSSLLNFAIDAEMYDIAMDLLACCPQLSTTVDLVGETTIKWLTERPNAFASGDSSAKSLCDRINHNHVLGELKNACSHMVLGAKSFCDGINHNHVLGGLKSACSPMVDGINHNHVLGGLKSACSHMVPGAKSFCDGINHIQALKVLKIVCSQLSSLDEPRPRELGVHDSLFIAAEYGIVEIVSELAKIDPGFLFAKRDGKNILSNAILHRQDGIFNFLCEKRGQMFALLYVALDNEGNNMLHYAGMLSPISQQRKVAGPAMQMQRELQWFKAVEKIMPSYLMDNVNHRGLKPRDLFTEKHTELVKEGEKWMKDTANSCMIVATLIATVTFAAAFTVPGGNDQELGYPIFLKRKLFLLFMISDALSLFSSSTSALLFVSIYTSRYAEEDFLKSLPSKLVIGLFALFFSIATMMGAFCTTMFLTIGRNYKWAAILVTVLAAVPVMLFIRSQFSLFLDMIRSTYGPGVFCRKGKKILTF